MQVDQAQKPSRSKTTVKWEKQVEKAGGGPPQNGCAGWPRYAHLGDRNKDEGDGQHDDAHDTEDGLLHAGVRAGQPQDWRHITEEVVCFPGGARRRAR